MLIIRYQRVGKKNHAQFKIIVAEKSSPVKGKFVEILGSRDPYQKQVVLREDRIKHWLKVGAQCSDSVYNLLVSKGIMKGPKRKINLKKKEVNEDQSKAEVKEDSPKLVESDEDKNEEKKEELVKENPSTEEKEDKKKESSEKDSTTSEEKAVQQEVKPESKKEDKK